MKRPEEINEMARVHANLKLNFDRADEEYYNSTAINAYESFKKGYTQCQADNAERKYTEAEVKKAEEAHLINELKSLVSECSQIHSEYIIAHIEDRINYLVNGI